MFESCFFDTEWLKLGVMPLNIFPQTATFYTLSCRDKNFGATFPLYLMCVLVIRETLECAAMSQSVRLFSVAAL